MTGKGDIRWGEVTRCQITRSVPDTKRGTWGVWHLCAQCWDVSQVGYRHVGSSVRWRGRI